MSLQLSVNHFLSSSATPKFPLPRLQIKTCVIKRVVSVHSQTISSEPEVRRSANYKPNLWDYESLMSLSSEYKEDMHRRKVNELKENVRQLINGSVGTEGVLDTIDAVKRLGVGHHYEKEIKTALDNIFLNGSQWSSKDLHTTSLAFRLLRQHGYDVHIDVFDNYVDENGNLKTCHSKDYKGLLSMYEASYFGLEDEDFMDEVKIFTAKYLKEFEGDANSTLAKKIFHALELPQHWRISRLESLWYIDTYESEENMIPVLLDLAKLDYNIVQATQHTEIGRLTRWWVDLGIHKMDFFRNRILEHYFWSLGMVPEEQYGLCRVGLAQVTQLITLIDDIYDVYGTYDELLLFTEAVERWEVSAMEKLPQYMKLVYMTLLNVHNELAYEILRDQAFDITPHQKKAWVDLCHAYILEAKWYRQGYKPTLKEFLGNSLTSSSGFLMIMTSYYLTTDKITKEALNYIESTPSLIYNSVAVLRLADDLGTSTDEMARGDVPKSVQCYMHEAGVSEEVAREHVKYLINEAWKKINTALLEPHPFSDHFVNGVPSIGRHAQCMYLYGDWHGAPDQGTVDHLKSLMVRPISLGSK
nr:gamma-terpinene synthase [Nigella sativa]